MSKKIRKSGKLVYGWGINDADYNINPYIDSKRVMCPYYRVWNHILERSLCPKFKSTDITYKDCTVGEEWMYFSNFKSWMEQQDWVGKQPDKDLLVKGNKHYSECTVVFISKRLNSFLSEVKKPNKLLGTSYVELHKSNPYKALCCGEYLGYFPTELEAHLAWKKRKHEIACELAKLETDPRIIHALTTRYAGDDIYEA